MKTEIKIKTWYCPSCFYRQDFEPTDELMEKHFQRESALCPSCGKVDLIKETDPSKKITFTVIGEEDIETEIKEIEERKAKGEELERDVDVSTKKKKEDYRIKRKQDIQDAIIEARKLEDK